MNMPGAEMHYMLRGRISGQYSIDLTSGWITSGTIERHIQGVAVVSSVISGQTQSAQWPLEVTEIQHVKRGTAKDSTTE
jgi:hypothetical protein